MSLNNFSIKIKPTILGLFFIVTAIVVTVMLVMQYNLSKKIALESTQESFKQLSVNLKKEVNNYIKNSESFIRLIENVPYVTQKPIPNERHDILELFVSDIKSNNYIYSIYVGHKDGSYYELINLNEEFKQSFKAPENALWLVIKIIDNIEYREYLDINLKQIKSKKSDTKYSVTQRPWYKDSIASTTSIKTEPYLFEFLNRYGISYAKKIKKSDNAVIGIDVTLNNIDKLISKENLVEGSEVFLFDNNGEIITYNKVSKDKANNKSSLNQNKLDKKLSNNQFFYNKYSLFNNSEYLYILSPIESIMQPYIKEIYWFVFVSFIVFLIVAIPLIVLSSKLIVNPLHKIVEENEKIKKRKFEEVKKIPSYIKEIHDVSDSLWKMSVSIKAYEDNQKELMDSFIKLIATAIDEKSKYTGGHCSRVPELALMIIEEANKCDEGIFKDFKINNEDEFREISISAWLHDCGKVTTPEYVVDKATKLETIYNRIHEIRTRFEVIHRDLIIKSYKKELDGENQQEIESWLKNELNELKKDFEFIAKMNLGGEFLNDEYKTRIKKIASRTWLRNFDDKLGLSREEGIRFENKDESLPTVENLLSDKSWHIIKREESIVNDDSKYGFKTEVPKDLYNQGEVYNLTISKGTLTEEERYKIQDHIKMTIKMLEQLPLPENMKNVPLYAGAHHETLIGTGYPKKLTKDDMPIPSRVLALADVFEALTASDRPYKDSKTLSESIKILSFMVKDQHIDKDIFELFLKTEVYKKYGKEYLLDDQIDEVEISDYLNLKV
ncbi:amino acid ABC transporter [Malaciobacter halophilus]|nr:HD domain-containing phosphohydrolase [Malaciobacter halophilus]RYA23619.1 amino acid ABC transporter [Malaciobacter halophilus]